MRSRVVSSLSRVLIAALLGALGLAASTQVSQQAPMARQAQMAARSPMKLDVSPVGKAYRVGETVGLEISLRDAYDRPVAATERTEIVVETLSPSQKKTSAVVYFEPGQTVQRFEFPAQEAGLTRVQARQKENQLREGSYVVLVNRPTKARSKALKTKKALKVKSSALRDDAGDWAAPWWYHGEARVRPVALHRAAAADPQGPGAGSQEQPAPASPKLLFQVAGGGHEFLADGHDAASILVFYMSPDGSGAPNNIKVWLTWSNGVLDPQQLTIRAGENIAEATLRSEWPVDARIAIVSSSPAVPIEGTREYTVKFVPPIYGINVHGPQRLSLVDNGMVVAEFYDPHGYPIQTTTKRTITFTPASSTVRLLPMQVEVEPGGSSATAFVLPAGLGRTELSVSTPGYKAVAAVVEITGLTVILLCLGGGIVGGFCAFNAFKGSLAWRIFLGVVGGAVLSWLYVYVALPKTDSRIAHNLVSVLFISIVGGYLGLQVLDFAAKQLGFIGGKTKP